MTDADGARRRRGEQPERGEARVNGIRLAYRTWAGPATASYPPVVLLHGLLQSGDGMANLAADLARCGPVIVPDLRGRGESDQPAGGYDPPTMAADVAGLIETLGLDRPVVIGRLHGGLIAYHLAARRPELVRGLVLGDTTPEVDEQRAERALARIRALPRQFASLDEATAFYLDVLNLSAARARHDIPHDLEAADGGFRWRHNLELVERIEAAAMPRSDWDVLTRVRCPVLLLRGQRGEVSREIANRFCQVVAGCRVQTVLGARHDVFIGPGAEQTFGATHLFLIQLASEPASRPAGAGPAAAAADAAPAGPVEEDGAAVVERMVRAINGRDDAVIAELFAADGRIVQYRPGGRVREGGPDAAKDAFWDIFAQLPGGAVAARDVIAAGDRVACVLTVQEAAPAADATGDGTAIVAPLFLRVRDGRIAELTSFGLRLPAEQI